ncbi:MAG: WG repeat-containing protein, partial [Cyclobacteriaceae bacterium]|nr:WG repeat-containing protein [Cyclobacteriaceae bacterium]
MKVVLWLVVSIFSCIAGLAETYNTFEVDGKMGLRDSNGNVVIPPAYDALGWSEGPFSVIGQVTGYKTSGRWGIIAVDNRAITEATYTGLIPAEGNLILAYKRMPGSSRFMAGCLDTSGKEVIPFQYEGLTINASRGIVYVRSGNSYRYGLLDLHNRAVIPIEYN